MHSAAFLVYLPICSTQCVSMRQAAIYGTVWEIQGTTIRSNTHTPRVVLVTLCTTDGKWHSVCYQCTLDLLNVCECGMIQKIALKYCLSMTVTALAVMHSVLNNQNASPSEFSKKILLISDCSLVRALEIMWVSLGTVTTLYSFYWDVIMNWYVPEFVKLF